jgi:hypothetical protein
MRGNPRMPATADRRGAAETTSAPPAPARPAAIGTPRGAYSAEPNKGDQDG